jgi:pSer/pThr/pTyr-binding forkhead associated (FHA) protein
VVGRTDDCHLLLDDERVSRRHASFRSVAGTIWVRDLDSRNGVKVNGMRITGNVELRAGDVVTVGSQEFRVASGRATSGSVTRVTADTLRRERRTLDPLPIDECWAAAEKAFAANESAHAEVLVGEALSQVYVGIAAGKFGPPELEQATRYAIKIASVSKAGKWLDWIFRAHEAAGRVLAMETIEEVDRVARTVRYRVGGAMKSYVTSLEKRAESLSPSDKFAMRRIQALLRTLIAA